MTWPMAGERIKSLRQLLGISQDELADAAGVSQALISHIEQGVRDASEDLIVAVASATATPRKFFEVTPVDIPLGSLRFRKNATASRRDTKRVKALFDEAFRLVQDLIAQTGYPAPNLPIMTGHVSSDDIENIAVQTREALQLGGDGPIRHLTRACERAGLAVTPLVLPGDHDADDEAIGHFGVSHWPGPHDPGLIGLFSGGSGDRQRFTVAHELAHLVLHNPRRREIQDPEGEANRLAGAILLPYDRAHEVLAGNVTLSDLAAVKAKWGISMQALIMRGNHLGLIDDQRKLSLFKQLSARGWRKNEPVVVHNEEPKLVWRLLVSQYGDPLPYSHVANATGLNPVVLRSLAPPPSAPNLPPQHRNGTKEPARRGATVSRLRLA
ncbi:XRE family transcriptional regulator [Catellatospora sp. KI3]|uniref:helix-turn-helix domain-containing protein n=1 Tax=Catellatospora sp. KI3 TaxID=3041620 RepID=UPI00248320BE|nr:XRE family transcriptional regulator [Catellatospora sp. KI3]MDI1464302.1 XRE family transcriptional regulator [Catellatospora sp. KI3]